MNVLQLAGGLVVCDRRQSAALLGRVNGILIGYFRLRAFLTTLITLIVYRSDL